jgi:cathepsin L
LYTYKKREKYKFKYIIYFKVKNCSNQTNNLKRYKVKGYQTVAHGDEEALKRAVATYGPVTIAFDASDWSFAHYRCGVYASKTCQKNVTNHAALIVGYGTSEDGVDYWIIKNSWGEKWGIDGYIYLARNQNNMCGVASVAVYAFL